MSDFNALIRESFARQTIMATIGALMYVSYVNLFKSSATKTGKLVDLSTFAPVSY